MALSEYCLEHSLSFVERYSMVHIVYYYYFWCTTSPVPFAQVQRAKLAVARDNERYRFLHHDAISLKNIKQTSHSVLSRQPAFTSLWATARIFPYKGSRLVQCSNMKTKQYSYRDPTRALHHNANEVWLEESFKPDYLIYAAFGTKNKKKKLQSDSSTKILSKSVPRKSSPSRWYNIWQTLMKTAMLTNHCNTCSKRCTRCNC